MSNTLILDPFPRTIVLFIGKRADGQGLELTEFDPAKHAAVAQQFIVWATNAWDWRQRADRPTRLVLLAGESLLPIPLPFIWAAKELGLAVDDKFTAWGKVESKDGKLHVRALIHGLGWDTSEQVERLLAAV